MDALTPRNRPRARLAALAAAMAAGAATARATFELENAVQTLDAETDSLFRYDAAAQRATEQQRPWRDNPHYFKQYARCDAALSLAPCAARLPIANTLSR
jgi:hypothetical protein